ncbi:MAG: sulfotransferase family 2 domain-containing protein [Gammaproteobacteria bacterium]
MISHRYKCIFVHIPKTGGYSITDVIWPSVTDRTEENLWMGFTNPHGNKHQTGGLQHLLGTMIRQEVGTEIFDSHWKFTIVRNPWDKAVSQYLYMRNRHDLRDFIGMKNDESLAGYLDLIKKKAHVQWEPQHKFVLDNNGDNLLDYIGRFEQLEQDASTILATIGCAAKKLPHLNKSNRKHYRDYFDDETREIVREFYAQDIELLEYEF